MQDHVTSRARCQLLRNEVELATSAGSKLVQWDCSVDICRPRNPLSDTVSDRELPPCFGPKRDVDGLACKAQAGCIAIYSRKGFLTPQCSISILSSKWHMQLQPCKTSDRQIFSRMVQYLKLFYVILPHTTTDSRELGIPSALPYISLRSAE